MDNPSNSDTRNDNSAFTGATAILSTFSYATPEGEAK